MNPHYSAVAQCAAHVREYCHAPEALFNMPFEVEHVVPSTAGGSDDLSNLALSCRSCNVHKGAAVMAVDPDTDRPVSLFNTRQDEWRTHFAIEESTGRIIGLTPLARATADRLRMNSRAQLSARAEWLKLGWIAS